MDKLKKNMVFYLLLLIDFYIVPCFIKNTGSAMIVMLVIIPLICLITSVFYGIRNGFNFWYILIVAIMFAPSIFIFYNSSAWVYVVGYAVIALLGNLIALPLGKDNFAFAKLPTQTCVCKMIPRFWRQRRGLLPPEAHEIAAGMAQIAQSAVFAH